MSYAVTLERGSDGGYMAWVHELPGCYARGPSREEVEAKIGPAIEGFLAWLRAAGEDVPDGPVAFAIVGEVHHPEPMQKGGGDVLLDPDRAPLTPSHWARVERWLHLSRRGLLRTLRRADVGEMDREVGDSPRTIRGHVEHIAFVEFMYAMWTFDLRSVRGLREFLAWTRRVAAGRMRALARANDDRVTTAEWSGAPRPEPWTARKAARRLLWHERLHTRAVERLLARRPGAVTRPS